MEQRAGRVAISQHSAGRIYQMGRVRMAMKPNYRYERSQRDKTKAAKKQAKLAGKAVKEKPSSIERKAREPAADES